jgi:hypothetical protein
VPLAFGATQIEASVPVAEGEFVVVVEPSPKSQLKVKVSVAKFEAVAENSIS